MWPDVIDLHTFYQSPLGHVAQRAVRGHVREFWPSVTGLNVMGLGYAIPFLRGWQEDAKQLVAVMPARMGVMAWPRERPNVTTIAHEIELPFADLSFDRILIVHGIEFSEHLRELLREVWRVLADGGRVLVVTPSRRGIWARMDHTPFGHGHPYSTAQLHRILRESLFAPIKSDRALYVPPSRRRFMLASAPVWEKLGSRWLRPLAGVTMVEAAKQIYGGTLMPARRARLSYLPVRPRVARAERASCGREGK